MSYDTSTVVSSRVKPKQKKVEVTMSLNTTCPNFDRSKAEQIALNVDGSDAKAMPKTTDEENNLQTFPEGEMDRLVLTSTKAVKDAGRYAVGILDANELHVTPLDAILSLRPNFEYLDKSDKTAKAEGRGLLNENEEDVDDPANEGADEMKAVTVRFAKGSQAAKDKAEKAKQKTFEYQQKKAEEEPWVRVRFNHVKTDRWTEESQKMFCKRMDDEIRTLNVKPDHYLDALK